ncbi:MAG: M13 family metallopeptidase [Lacibacter sp.]
MRSFAISLLCFALFSSCKNETSTKPDALASNMDTTVNPAQDFFLYANGGWIKKNPIPADESSWGIGNLVINENLNRLKTINENAAKENAAAGSTSQKIGDFWKSAMDSTAIEQNGLKPLQPMFDKINGISNLKQLSNVMAEMDKIGASTMVGSYIGQDAKNSDVVSLQFWQTGLGLPEREYYFKTDSTTENIRKEYVKYIAKILTMSGVDAVVADEAAADILKMETSIAQVHRKLADLRDPYRNYNKYSSENFYKLAPSLDLENYLKTVGIPKVDSVIVGQPEYYKTLETIAKSTSLDTWKQLLRFRLISSFNIALPDAYGVEAFNFRKLMSGAKERKPRWKRVLQTEEGVMGELLGQLYVKEYFNETAKKRYSDLVEAIRTALKERIEKLDWMSDSTKQKAYLKLSTMKKKVGYPDKWKDFSAMQISTESFVANLISANTWWNNYSINKLGKPVDRDEWDMYPQTYNAYYNPSNNEIVLPAGIFTVPGYKDEELDDALVYGYAGATTIGHEITHGFDDEGRQYDEKGNLKSWWTKGDEEKFNKKAEVMVNQYSAYKPFEGYNINGKATLGENIADLGGGLLGWDAFVKTEQYKKEEPIAGLSPAKRFFLGYALGWLGHTRDESLKNQLLVDVHSPAKWRVNGPFVSMPSFYSTFTVKEGDAMFVADSARVKIW